MKIAINQNNQKYPAEKLEKLSRERRFFLHTQNEKAKFFDLMTEHHSTAYGQERKHPDAELTANYWAIRFWPERIVVTAKLAVRDSRFSDYILPYLLAAFAVFVWFCVLLPE